MRRRDKSLLAILIALTSMSLTFQNCGRDFDIDKFQLNSQESTPTLGTSGGNPGPQDETGVTLSPFEDVGVTATLCIQHLELYIKGGNGDFFPLIRRAEVILDPEGTHLTSDPIPEKKYGRIEFLLTPTYCSSGLSVQLTNQYGTFETDERIEVISSADFEVTSDSAGNVTFLTQELVNALSTVRSSAEIKPAIEAIDLKMQ